MGLIAIVRWDYEPTQRSGTTLYGNKTQDGEVEVGICLRVKSYVNETCIYIYIYIIHTYYKCIVYIYQEY